MKIQEDQPICTVEELQSVVSEITMKNTSLDFNWNFVVLEVQDQGWFIQVEFQRPDTSTGLVGTGRSRKEFVAKGTWVSGVVKTCWLLLELTIRHELMEAFRWRDCRIFNPHHSVFDLARIEY